MSIVYMGTIVDHGSQQLAIFGRYNRLGSRALQWREVQPLVSVAFDQKLNRPVTEATVTIVKEDGFIR